MSRKNKGRNGLFLAITNRFMTLKTFDMINLFNITKTNSWLSKMMNLQSKRTYSQNVNSKYEDYWSTRRCSLNPKILVQNYHSPEPLWCIWYTHRSFQIQSSNVNVSTVCTRFIRMRTDYYVYFMSYEDFHYFDMMNLPLNKIS